MTAASDKPSATAIDLESFARKETYLHFKDFEIPVSWRTVQVEINKVHNFVKQRELSLPLVISHLITKAANKIPEFRHRIDNDCLVEYERIEPRVALLKKNKTIAFTSLAFSDCFDKDYVSNQKIAHETSASTSAQQPTPDHQGFIYISPALMHNYMSITFPYSRHSASIPVFHFGKYAKHSEQLLLPLSMQLNHALIDAYHVQLFLRLLESYLEDPQQSLYPAEPEKAQGVQAS